MPRLPIDPAFARRVINQPRAGFFSYRDKKGAPPVAARIGYVFGMYSLEIAGKVIGEAAWDWAEVPGLSDVWEWGVELTETDYHRMLAPRPPSTF